MVCIIKTTHRSAKTIIPKNTLEYDRLYKLIIAMCKDKVVGRKCTPKDGMDYKSKLRTALINDNCVLTNIYDLKNCIQDMFGKTNELENTELTIHNDYTGITNATYQDIVVKRADNTCHNNSTNASVLKWLLIMSLHRVEQK